MSSFIDNTEKRRWKDHVGLSCSGTSHCLVASNINVGVHVNFETITLNQRHSRCERNEKDGWKNHRLDNVDDMHGVVTCKVLEGMWKSYEPTCLYIYVFCCQWMRHGNNVTQPQQTDG